MSKIEKALEKFKKKSKEDVEQIPPDKGEVAKDYTGIVPPVQETNIDEHKTEDVIPSIKIDTFNVEDRIVAYHDLVGKQTWEGPVMVHFRNLQVTLNKLQGRNMCKVVVFTSASENEGKSLIALNTAITLCNDKKSKIVFVNCDFRKHVAHRSLGFDPGKGLEQYLADEAEIKEVTYSGILPNFTMIPIGDKPSNPCELLASDKMKELLSYLRERFDYVIIDAPPVIAFPDMAVLAPLSDGVVFVINSKKSKRSIVKRAVETLRDCNVMGFVMNRSEIIGSNSYGYSSSYDNYDYTKS